MKKVVSFLLVMVMTLTMFGGCSSAPPAPASSKTPAASSSVSTSGAPKTDWPKKAIQVIAPYKPGGDTDFNARAYAKFLEAELGQPVVIVNVDGSGGVVGSRKVKDATPDGYTALFFHSAILVNELAGTADFSYKNFEYVATVGEGSGDIIAVNAKSGLKTFKDLVEYSKKHPGELKVAVDMGTIVHVTGFMLQEAGLDANLVSAGGAAERVAALKGGHVDVILNGYGTIKDYLTTGEFVALGMTNNTRTQAFKDIPTVAEQGYDVAFTKHYFFMMPKGTPKEIVDKFASALKKVSEKPEYQKMIYDAYGQNTIFKSPKEGFADMDKVSARIAKYKDRFKTK